MNTPFQIKAIDPHQFSHLMQLSADELAAHHATWVTADANPGYPCRVSLEDATVGEQILLVPFAHHAVDSPYRAYGPIYVRFNAIQTTVKENQVPKMLNQRAQSIRAYNQAGRMVVAEVAAVGEVKAVIERQLRNPAVEYIHLHNAGPGCFNCSVVRVEL